MSNDEMKTIDDKVRDLKNEKKRLTKERKELLSKAETLKPKIERRKKSFLKWHNLYNISGKMFWLSCILAVIFIFLGIFRSMTYETSYGPGFEITRHYHHAEGIALIILGIIIVYVSYYIAVDFIGKKAQVYYNGFREASAELTNIQTRIKQIEIVEVESKTEMRMRRKGLVPFVDRLGRKRFGTPKQIREWKNMDMDMRNGFSKLKPREFEKLIRELFVKMGYEASLTPYIADFGADIVAKKGTDTIVIQVKKYGRENKVGSPEVQRLLGSMFKYKANKAIFITTSEFTEEAYEQARDAPIELWDYIILNEKIEQHLLNLKSDNF